VNVAAAAAVSASARAVTELRPVPDIVMRAAVTAVPDPAQRDRGLVATVLGIELPVSEPAPITADVEVSAYDSDGRQHGVDKQTLTLTPTPGARMVVVDVLSKMLVRPGTYEIRASAVTGRGKVGSVYTHVDVENFSRAPLAVSGLLLHASTAPRLVTTAEPAAWLPLSPSTVRDFARTDRVTAAVRLVQPRELASTAVAIETAIVDPTGRPVTTIQAELSPQAFSAARVADYHLELPLASLEDGDYLLTIASTLGRTKVTRTARFRIR
jgi:hypothetical protein